MNASFVERGHFVFIRVVCDVIERNSCGNEFLNFYSNLNLFKLGIPVWRFN